MSIDHLNMNNNIESEKFIEKIRAPLEVEGGKTFINRIIHLFGLRSKVELSDIIGISTGSLATWQTRSTMPYELAIRIHLATGVSMQYLLFDEAEPDLNVMRYCEDPSLPPNFFSVSSNLKNFRYSLSSPPNYDGGSQIIERLIRLFRLESKVQLSELIGVSIGTLSTWHTRKITPFELLARVHIVAGFSMELLCFGKVWEEEKSTHTAPEWMSKAPPSHDKQNQRNSKIVPNWMLEHINEVNKIRIYSIDNGEFNVVGHFDTNEKLLNSCGLSHDGFAVCIKDNHYFINPHVTLVTKGKYLFSVNNVYQLGDLQMLPDGYVYLFNEDDKYKVDPNTTKIHGKVVSILEKL